MIVKGFEYLGNSGDTKKFRHIETGVEVKLSSCAQAVLREEQLKHELWYSVVRELQRKKKPPEGVTGGQDRRERIY